ATGECRSPWAERDPPILAPQRCRYRERGRAAAEKSQSTAQGRAPSTSELPRREKRVPEKSVRSRERRSPYRTSRMRVAASAKRTGEERPRCSEQRTVDDQNGSHPGPIGRRQSPRTRPPG